SMDSRGTKSVGPYQATLFGAINGLTFPYARTSLTAVQTMEWDELHYLSLAHEEVLTSGGLKADVSVTYSISEPGTEVLRALELISESLTVKAGLRYPAIRSRQQNLSLFGKFEMRDSESEQLSTVTSRDRLRLIRTGFEYDYSDALNGVNQFNVEYSRGLGILNATEDNDPLKSRSDAERDFSKFLITASRTQELWANWSAYLGIQGQVALNGLSSSEECGFGGESYGRAYDSSEITGDNCIMGSLELRYLFRPESKDSLLKYAQLIGYYDLGQTTQRTVLNTQAKANSASSASIGLRLGFDHNVTAFGEVAKPLTRDASEQGDDDVRVFGKISVSF
ncbi:MAG: ShlB/FhaC/HecB family hemolysin secretion/activation protein, partial [Magnetococcales bacterium]|nr:ShlB/FhaC/HecB family hemolysin secretion/activation protein [Magnetococcales bacterium]